MNTNQQADYEAALVKVKEYEALQAKIETARKADVERVQNYYTAHIVARREYGRNYYKKKMEAKAQATAA